jgi:hypothetical protein
MNKRQAFSVADILITMVVMGFGYMFVMPQLMNYSSKNKQTPSDAAPYQKAVVYSKDNDEAIIRQATATISAENGGTLQGLCSDNKCFLDKYASVLSVLKKCDASNVKECWNEDGASGMILINGTLFAITDTNPSGDAKIKIDVNGFALPNQAGVDIYEADIVSGSLTSFK